MWEKVLLALAFLLIPILWGVAVNGLFDLWNGKGDEHSDEDRIFPDYQI